MNSQQIRLKYKAYPTLDSSGLPKKLLKYRILFQKIGRNAESDGSRDGTNSYGIVIGISVDRG